MDSYIGQIQLFAFSHREIEGWRKCDGSAINVCDNPALFSLIGTTYGGDARAFLLPDLSNMVPMEGMMYYICVQGNYPVG